MIKYDLHIHTAYCGHADQMTVDVIAESSRRAGLDTVAITDHIYRPGGMATIEKIRQEVSAVETDVRVLVGAEIDVDGRYADGRLVEDIHEGLDYVIAGLHYIPVAGNYPRSPEDCPFGDEEMIDLWRGAVMGIVSNPAVDTLAHPARLIATSVADYDAHFDLILSIFEEAAEISAKNNIAWEINELSGHKLGKNRRMTLPVIFRNAVDNGVKLVFGSDAHFPEQIGRQVFAQMVLEEIGRNNLSGPEDLGLI